MARGRNLPLLQARYAEGSGGGIHGRTRGQAAAADRRAMRAPATSELRRDAIQIDAPAIACTRTGMQQMHIGCQSDVNSELVVRSREPSSCGLWLPMSHNSISVQMFKSVICGTPLKSDKMERCISEWKFHILLLNLTTIHLTEHP